MNSQGMQGRRLYSRKSKWVLNDFDNLKHVYPLRAAEAVSTRRATARYYKPALRSFLSIFVNALALRFPSATVAAPVNRRGVRGSALYAVHNRFLELFS